MDRLVSSHNGRYVAVCQKEEPTFTHRYRDTAIRLGLVDPATGSVRWVSTTRGDEQEGHYPMIRDMAISNDGKRIVLFGHNGKSGWVYVADAEKEQMLWEHREIKDSFVFEDGDIGPDGSVVYTGGAAGWLYCFDGRTGEQIARWDHGDAIGDIKVDPHGGLVAVAGGGVKLYDADTGERVQTIRPPYSFTNICFSPNGKQLAVAAETSIWIYDVHADDAAR